MASRDLTSVFIERRSAANLRRAGGGDKFTSGGHHDDHYLMAEEGVTALGAGGAMTGGGSALPPQWVDEADAVHTVISDIVRSMDVLTGMHASRVGSVFGKDLDDTERKIERLTEDITAKFRKAEKHLQKVGNATKRAGGEEATVGANVQRSLAKKLQELSVEFRQSQRKYLADVRAQKGGGAMGGDDKFGIDLDGRGSVGGDGGDGYSHMSTQQVTMVEDLTEAVQSRDQEIAKIAQSIEELGTIFKELAVLVIDQGTILDRIDYNMEAVVEHTKTGINQLDKAERAQKSARPLKCIFCLLGVIFVLLFILVLKHRH